MWVKRLSYLFYMFINSAEFRVYNSPALNQYGSYLINNVSLFQRGPYSSSLFYFNNNCTFLFIRA